MRAFNPHVKKGGEYMEYTIIEDKLPVSSGERFVFATFQCPLQDPKQAAKNADVVFSDKVVSLNDKGNKEKKIRDFKNYKINSELMKVTRPQSIFLHCLPRGKEVDEKIFYSKQSKVWQQALNRVHVQKSILLYCFGKLR